MALLALHHGNIFDDSLCHFITLSELLTTSCASRQAAAAFTKKFHPDVFLTLVRPRWRGGKQRVKVAAANTPGSTKRLLVQMEVPLWNGSPSLEERLFKALPSPEKWWSSTDLAITGLALKAQRGRYDAALDAVVEQVPLGQLRYLVLPDIHAAAFLPSSLTENAALDMVFCECPSDGIIGRLHHYPKCMVFGWGCTGATPWIRQRPARALETEGLGDLLLQPSGFTCWCPSTQICSQLLELGLDITTGSSFPPACVRWSIDAVSHRIDFFFPALRTICVNLEICYGSDHGKITRLLHSFVQGGVQVKTFELYLTLPPSGEGKQDQKFAAVVSDLREAGVEMTMPPRWRGRDEVPNNGWMLPAILRHKMPQQICSSIEDVIWNDA